MTREEAINRLNRIAEKAVHTHSETPFVMSIDDGIAVHMAVDALKGAKGDCISRQAAIDAIESHIRTAEEPYHLSRVEEVMNHVFEIAASCVYNLPSAQPEQRWIPCEERLPEEGQLVLTTIRGTDVIRVEDGETFEDAIDRSRKIVRVSVGFIGSDGWYGIDGYPEIVAPCAWMPMPLPEPWKEGEA